MKSNDQILRELTDREAIRELPVRYCDCLRRKDFEGLLDLFTRDATYVIKGIEVEAVSRGFAEIKRMHQKALSETTPRQFIHNQLVQLTGEDRATGRCAVEVRNAGLTMEWLGIGYFEDEYAKIDGEWKFSRRFHSFEGLDDKVYLRTFIP